jgi:hypothetical protein
VLLHMSGKRLSRLRRFVPVCRTLANYAGMTGINLYF